MSARTRIFKVFNKIIDKLYTIEAFTKELKTVETTGDDRLKVRRLNNWYNLTNEGGSRPSSADLVSDNYGGMRKFLATTNMTTNKPATDGHIINLDWDNNNVWNSQLFVSNQGNIMQMRSNTTSGWTPWKELEKSFYCTCDTAASTAAKVAVCTSFNSDDLRTGTVIKVRFSHDNSAMSPTLNVNSTGAKSIIYYGGITASATFCPYWYENEVLTFVYDGTNWTTRETWVREEYLLWGGRNRNNSYSPIDANFIPSLSTNRFELLDPAGITVEYSTDGGTSWIDYGLSDAAKRSIFSSFRDDWVTLGKHTTAGTNTTNDQLRITITCSPDSSVPNAGVYTDFSKLAIYSRTRYNTMQVKFERELRTNVGTFETVTDWTTISGNAGWSILNFPQMRTYGNSGSSTAQYSKLRLTFRQTAVNTSYSSAGINRIQAYGSGYLYSAPSNLARTGHLYTYDMSENATFPANITATGTIYGTSMSQTIATAGTGTVGYLISPKVLNDTITGKTAVTIASSTAANQLTLAFGSKYSINAGGTPYIFTMPSLPIYDGTVV